MTITIGIDPHKASHTAVAIDDSEAVLGEHRVRASAAQATVLLDWARSFEPRTWAVESAAGLGYLLAQQLVAAGETVVDVPPLLACRVRVLGSGRSQKNDPNDARSVAVAALRSDRLDRVRPDDHARVLALLAGCQAGLAPPCSPELAPPVVSWTTPATVTMERWAGGSVSLRSSLARRFCGTGTPIESNRRFVKSVEGCSSPASGSCSWRTASTTQPAVQIGVVIFEMSVPSPSNPLG
jgi:hypothetical protein